MLSDWLLYRDYVCVTNKNSIAAAFSRASPVDVLHSHLQNFMLTMYKVSG